MLTYTGKCGMDRESDRDTNIQIARTHTFVTSHDLKRHVGEKKTCQCILLFYLVEKFSQK